MAVKTPQRGRGRIPVPGAGDSEQTRIALDIRSGKPFFLTRSQLANAGRRLASIGTLVALDFAGLVLGVYAALVVRELYYGTHPLWGFLWRGETHWLPFLALVTGLVFAPAALYAQRERGPGVGRNTS